jgi:nitroreductase
MSAAVAPRAAALDVGPDPRAFARYRQADAPGRLATGATLDLLLSHRSVRAYTPEPVPETVLTSLVAAAQSASSSSNLQVWSVVAVRDAARKARLSELAGRQRQIFEAPLLLVWLIDFDRLTRLAATRGVAVGALDYTETFVLGAVDTAIAAQNAAVALESLGYGACYIGGIRNHPAEVAAELELAPRMFPLFGLTVGRPDPTRPAAIKPRLPQTSVLFHETYGWTAAQQAAAEAYGPALRAFQREQGMTERDWIEQASERTRGPESMAGRHVLRPRAADPRLPVGVAGRAGREETYRPFSQSLARSQGYARSFDARLREKLNNASETDRWFSPDIWDYLAILKQGERDLTLCRGPP